MPKHEIYTAKLPWFADNCVLFVTAFFNAGGYPRAESFLLIPDEKETIFAKRLNFDVKSFADSPVELDEDFMLDQAFGQATIDLSQYIENHGKGFSDLWDPAALIKPADIKFLVRLWVRGNLKHLSEVYRLTESDQLRDGLLPILDLPKISIRDF